jgi:ABC-type enterochelin transport system substrate-binding protein
MKKVHFLLLVCLSILFTACSSDKEKKSSSLTVSVFAVATDSIVTVYKSGQTFVFAKPVSLDSVEQKGINLGAIAEAEVHKGELIQFPKKGIMTKIKEEIGDDQIFDLIEILICVLIIVLILKILGWF